MFILYFQEDQAKRKEYSLIIAVFHTNELIICNLLKFSRISALFSHYPCILATIRLEVGSFLRSLNKAIFGAIDFIISAY